jgi:hypothetical protein
VELAATFADPRFELIRRHSNIGTVSNINLLLAEVDTEYVAILHQDDWWEPEFLATMLRLLDDARSALLATCAVRLLRPNGGEEVTGFHTWWGRSGLCESSEALRTVVLPNRIFIPGVVVRTDLHRVVGSYEASLPLVYDWNMWMHAAALGDFQVTDEVLANYRYHAGSLTSDAARRNLWALDLVKLWRVMESEWPADVEPYQRARRTLQASIWGMILGEAWGLAKTGDRKQARFAAMLAGSVAPSMRARLLAFASRIGANIPLRRFGSVVQNADWILKAVAHRTRRARTS